MSQLEEILNKLDDAKRTAALNPDAPEYSRTRSGIETAVREAKIEAKKLSKEYETAVLGSGVAIFLFGSPEKTKAFGDLVAEMGEAVVVDASAMYKRIATSVALTLGPSREFSSTQALAVSTRVQDVANELDLRLNKRLFTTDTPVLPTFEDVVDHVRKIIRAQLGDTLAAEYLKRNLALEAEKIRYMLSVAPVIILNATEDEFNGLGHMFGKGTAAVNVNGDEEINKEYITQTFQTVQKNLKKK